MGNRAISRELTDEFVRRWYETNPGGVVIVRDLTATAISAVSAAWVAANYTPEKLRSAEQSELLKLSAELIAELQRADEYAIGMPMHNWGPPAALKLWVDQIVTPLTKSTRPLAGKRATFIVAAGGSYAPASKDASKNYLVPWLRTVFGFLGVDDTQFVIADGSRAMHSGKIGRTDFLAAHIKGVTDLFSAETAERVGSAR